MCLRQDLELDLPDAAHYVALFLGRAIVDEALPPAFLTAVLQRINDDSLGVHIVRSVGQCHHFCLFVVSRSAVKSHQHSFCMQNSLISAC